MNRHAKASSAASTQRQAGGLGRFVRGAFVTRGASSDADGSGAPSYRGRLALLALTALALTGLVLLVAQAFASKQVIDYFGASGSEGGQLNNPRDIAVNRSGAGPADQGDVYVADDENQRIQRFDAEGNFVSAWGANVLTPSVDEEQTLTVEATGGTYVLSYAGEETAALAHDASSTTVRNALRALPAIGSPNVNVFGSAEAGFTIEFRSALAATNVAQISVDDSNLSGAASTGHPQQGFGAYEVCTVAANCIRGSGTGSANFNDNAKNGALDNPQSVAVDNDTGNVYVSDRDNRRVSEYTGTGTFIRSFGWGVDATESGSEYEVCPAANRCTAGIAGSGVGQYGSGTTTSAWGIAISPPDGEAAVGTVFLADSGNRRVDTYNVDGTSPASFGSSANFGSAQPRNIAVDSRGIVYASDSNSSAQIDRYDTENANGEGVGFLASIAAPPLLAGGSTATAGLAVDPDNDEGGPDTDVLYVLRDPSSGSTVVQQFGPTNDPGLTTAPTEADDTHGAEAGFTSVQGFGLDNVSGRLFVSATNNVSGISGHRVYVLDEITAPAAALDPVSGISAHSATFSGEVNPNGNQTRYRFEYVDDAEFQATGFENAAKFPIADVDLGAGSSAIPVEAEIPHHLVPATEYHARLVAKQVFTSTETIGGPETFTTLAAAPSFQAIAIAGEEEATLRAAINPEGQEVTNYHFNWGATESYGNSTTPGTIPAGGEPVAAEEELSGLTPGQTYHFQLVATNGAGTTEGPDRTFMATEPPQFPQRAYELVSQYPTGGVAPSTIPGWQSVSDDGNRFAITSLDYLPGSTLAEPPGYMHEGGNNPRQDQFVRGSDGWHVRETGLGSHGWAADGTSLLTVVRLNGDQDPYGRLDPDDQNNSHDVYLLGPDGKMTWISRDPRIPVGTPQTAGGEATVSSQGFSSVSADGSTVVFTTTRQLLDADTDGGTSTYTWQNGELSLGLGYRRKIGSPLRSYSGDLWFFSDATRLTPDSGASNGSRTSMPKTSTAANCAT